MSKPDRLVVCASHSPGKDRDVDEVYGSEFRGALTRARSLVLDFDPDYIVLFGGDHRRAFRTIVPTFGVAQSAGIMAEAGHPAAELNVPRAKARALAEHLLASDIDITMCRDIELDHAFAQPLRDLAGDEGRYPVIPIPINCATAPLPHARRVLALGDAVSNYLAAQSRGRHLRHQRRGAGTHHRRRFGSCAQEDQARVGSGVPCCARRLGPCGVDRTRRWRSRGRRSGCQRSAYLACSRRCRRREAARRPRLPAGGGVDHRYGYRRIGLVGPRDE